GASAFVVLKDRNEIEARRQQARRAVDEMYTEFAQRWWSHQPHMELVQREFLLKALKFYQEFGEQPGNNPQTRQEAARAWRRVGEIQHRLGQLTEAENAFDQASSLASGEELAYCHNERGHLLRTAGRLPEAEQAFRQARQLF